MIDEVKKLQQAKSKYIEAHKQLCNKAKNLGWVFYNRFQVVHLISPKLVDLICKEQGFQLNYDHLEDFITQHLDTYMYKYKNTEDIIFVEYDD